MISLLFSGIIILSVNGKSQSWSSKSNYEYGQSMEETYNDMNEDEFDGLDGRVFHSVFYRFKDEYGMDKACDFCLNFNEAIKYGTLTAVSVHCGIQNSMEDASFGPKMKLDKSVEYGIVLTFRTLEDKLDVIHNNYLYKTFRSELDKLRDTECDDDEYDGIFVMDFVHGERERTNGRMPGSANGPRILSSGSVYHFVFVRYNKIEGTFEAIPWLVDIYRDLRLNSVDPQNEERTLITSQIWGQVTVNEEMLGFTPKGYQNNLGLEFAFCPTFNNKLDRDIYIGKIDGKLPEEIKYIGYDGAHDLYQQIIPSIYYDKVFVFDFTDQVFEYDI